VEGLDEGDGLELAELDGLVDCEELGELEGDGDELAEDDGEDDGDVEPVAGAS
jgi:hypothetical protein